MKLLNSALVIYNLPFGVYSQRINFNSKQTALFYFLFFPSFFSPHPAYEYINHISSTEELRL